MDFFAPLPAPRILCVMPTFQCTAACRHCGTFSNPAEKTWLPVEHMRAAIDQAAAAGYTGVVFTGGEPTLAGENLLEAMRRASAYGLGLRLVTNAHWAASAEAAASFIAELVAAGLHEINLSTGDQHARFVPLENILRAAEAAVRAGLSTVIIVETEEGRAITREAVEARAEFRRINQEHPYATIVVLEWFWSPLSPRNLHAYAPEAATNRANLPLRKGCDSILTTTTLQADGKLSACCGLGIRFIPELEIGRISETELAEADRTAAADFLKRWIRVEGPERILAWAAACDPEIEWEDMYAHRCQACIRLYKDPKVRRVIAERYQEKIADVLFAEWLLTRYEAATDA